MPRFPSGKRLKATYTVNPSGEITGVTDQEWSARLGRWPLEEEEGQVGLSAARVSPMLLAAGEPPVPYLATGAAAHPSAMHDPAITA